jgi:CheY-like chemotaxis protein
LNQCLILLVEDDANDAFFVARALKDLGFNGKIEHVKDTVGARDYLEGTGRFENRREFPLPDVVVSDSVLSGRGSGIELLEWMRACAPLKNVPFIILSGEVTPDVRKRATAAGVQLMLSKGSSFRDTAAALRDVLLQMPPGRQTELEK